MSKEKLKLKGIIEGLLFASGDEGMTIKQLGQVVQEDDSIVHDIIEMLREEYKDLGRGVMVLQSNEIYHLTTKPEHNDYYKRHVQNPRASRMSQASLETLAIIAYQQPITKTEIEEIRGVNSDYAVQTLVARSLVENIGRKETIGRPILYATTKEFLTYFGLSSLDELPPLPNNFSEENVVDEANLFFDEWTQK